jgi:hypothetical protein
LRISVLWLEGTKRDISNKTASNNAEAEHFFPFQGSAISTKIKRRKEVNTTKWCPPYVRHLGIVEMSPLSVLKVLQDLLLLSTFFFLSKHSTSTWEI